MSEQDFTGQDLTGQRAIAIFLLAGVAFSPVFLAIFSEQWGMFGIPALFLYLFLAWGIVVLAIAVNVFRTGIKGRDRQERPPQERLVQSSAGAPEAAMDVGDMKKPSDLLRRGRG